MPYVSLAQEGYFHANKAKLERQGVNVAEWDAATKGKKLPKRVAKYDGGDQIPEDGSFTKPISRSVRDMALEHLRRMRAGTDFLDPAKSGVPSPTPVPEGTPGPRNIPNDRKIYEQNPDLQGSYDGGTPSTTTNPTQNTDANQAGAGGSPFSNYGQNLGQGINPWDNTWGNVGGAYSAPMDPHAQQGLSNISGFANSGQNLGSAQNYNNQVLNGDYLTTNTNPYLAQIQSGMQGQKDSQDALEQRQLGSAMAAGGNALSGARMEQGSRYQNLSNANFNQTMGSLLSQNYQNERGLQNSASNNANNLSKTQMAGYQAQMNAGMVPTQMAQDDINRQYADWRTSTQNMYNDYTNGGKTFNDLMKATPGSYSPTYGNSAATNALGAGSTIADLIKGLTKPSTKSPGTGGNTGGAAPSTTGTNGTNGSADTGQTGYGNIAGYDDNGNPVYQGSDGSYQNGDGSTYTGDPNALNFGDQNMYDPNASQNMIDPNAAGGGYGGYDPNQGTYGGSSGDPIVDYSSYDNSGDSGNGL